MAENASIANDTVIDLYERRARAYDRDRSRSLQERAWLDRFLGYVPVSPPTPGEARR